MNRKIVIKNIISSLVFQFSTIVYGFIIPILIIKKYGSGVNGLVSSITQFIAYISLLEAGIGPVIKNALFKPIVEKKCKNIEQILGASSKFFKKIAYILVLYVFILCVIYPKINSDFSNLYTVSLIIIISISQFAEYFFGMTYKLFLQADQKNYVIDYINALGYAINLILMIILIKIGCNIQMVKLISSIVFILKPIILKIYFDTNYGYKITKKSDYKFEKQWDGLTHHIAAATQSNIDITILTIFSELKNISIYSIYSLIIKAIRSIIVSLTNGIDSFFGKKMITDSSEKINKNFSMYTFLFYTISTILIICTLFLIIPFVSIYTKNITDANYIQPTFAYVLVLAEFNYIIRYPYSTIVYAKGHFKETKVFSIIEPIINIILSVLLVFKYGLLGVAIGTLISMLIRSIGFIDYASKKILKIKLIDSMKIIIISYGEIIISLAIHLMIGNIMVKNYIQWFIYALILFIIISLIVILINSLFYKSIFKEIVNKIRRKYE